MIGQYEQWIFTTTTGTQSFESEVLELKLPLIGLNCLIIDQAPHMCQFHFSEIKNEHNGGHTAFNLDTTERYTILVQD